MNPSGKKLLIVDGDSSWRELLGEFFEMNSFQAILAGSGIEALSALDSNPDLVLLDLALPEMNGVALIREIHRRHPETTPRILVCGNGPRPLEIAALIDQVLPKPLSLPLLLSEVTRLLKLPRKSNHSG